MTISIIVAVADNGIIGKENGLPWHLGADLKRFKAITTGHTILMGKNTYLSIGRPLPNRRNVVLSSSLTADDVPGCELIASLDEIDKLGYNVDNKSREGLLYHREDQVVARDILILRKK